MKTINNFKFKCIFTLVLSLAVIFSVAGVFSVGSTKKASAVNTANAELFLPSSELEYRPLTSPTNIYHDDDVTAIIENTATPTLGVTYKGITKTLSATQLTGVNRLDENTLIFTTEARLKKIDLTTFETENLTPLSLGTEFDDKAVSHFDLNANYVVTTHQKLTAFSIGEEITKLPTEIDVSFKSPVAINDNGLIFYVNVDGELCYTSVDAIDGEPIFLLPVTPTAITADNDFVYYVHNNKVYRINIATKESDTLTAKDDFYQLGNFITPAGIMLRNGNLLISDTSLNAVQEFKINGTTLEFTGFAIAKGKTAYNRLTSDGFDIEKCGDSIAVLDGYKLSVINTKTVDLYSKTNFKNYLRSDDLGAEANGIALGCEKVLIFSGSNNFRILNLKDDSFSTINLPEHHVYDACYQSGKFFVYAYTDSNSRVVYSIDENDANFNTVKVIEDQIDAKIITVDVFGNIYLANDTTVYEYEKANGYARETVKDDRSGIDKMQTDLGGNLYILDDQGVSVWDGQDFAKIDLTSPTAKAIKSFALDFVTSSAYFIYDGEETVCVSKDLNNTSLKDATLPADYIIADANADIDTLKIYKPIDGANVYSVTKTETAFDYDGLIQERKEYAFICPVVIDNGIVSLTLYALAGQTEVVLVNSLELEEIELKVIDAATDTAYTATGVNAYYLPIMTKNGEYSLVDGQDEIRLSSGTKISPIKVLSFLDNEFYYAEIEFNGVTYKGYVPTAFTVTSLSKDFELENFTYQTVKETTLYADSDFSEKITLLDSGTVVKLYSISDGVATVAVEIDGVWTLGYISEKDIQDEPSRAVRNALLIIAIAACLSATTTYFVLKKKN